MGGTQWNHVVDRPIIPIVWLVKIKINLMQDEIVSFEEEKLVYNKIITYLSSKFIWWGKFYSNKSFVQ
jgi:hypothetical protein